jgi:aldehyde dehydrogenase (NAD+)
MPDKTNLQWKVDKAYIDGTFVPVQGSEVVESVNPATERLIGTATLANREDAKRAIAAAKRVQEGLIRSSKTERIDMLKCLQAAVLARTEQIRDITMEEYGGPLARAAHCIHLSTSFKGIPHDV